MMTAASRVCTDCRKTALGKDADRHEIPKLCNTMQELTETAPRTVKI